MSGILGNFPGGGKNNGKYVWSKCTQTTFYVEHNSIISTKTIVYDSATHQTIQLYTGSKYTFDESTGNFTIVNPTIVDVSYGGSYSFSASNKLFTIGSPTSSVMFKSGSNSNLQRTHVYNDASGVYVQGGSSGTYRYTYYSSLSYNLFNTIGYVVSDNENAYPNGAVHTDGYAYDTALKGSYVWNRFKYIGGVKGDWIDFVVSDNGSDYPNGAVHTDGFWYELSDTANINVLTGTVYSVGSTDIAIEIGRTPIYFGISNLDVQITNESNRPSTSYPCTLTLSEDGTRINVTFDEGGSSTLCGFKIISIEFTWFAI